MTVPPSTPNEWLIYIAGIAERHRFTTITPAGEQLQAALIGFLRTAGTDGTGLLDLKADFITVFPRFFNALAQAGQGGDVHGEDFVRLIEMLFEHITTDADELAARQAAERKH